MVFAVHLNDEFSHSNINKKCIDFYKAKHRRSMYFNSTGWRIAPKEKQTMAIAKRGNGE